MNGYWIMPETLDDRGFDPEYDVEDLREYATGGDLLADLLRADEIEDAP